MTLRVGLFSSKPYDENVFRPLADGEKVTFDFLNMPLTPDTALLCEKYDAVCVFVNDEVSSATLSALAASGVRHVALRCAGFNNVDINEAHRLGIAISRVPAYGPEAVAEHAIALMLTLNRKTHKAYNRVKEGNFELNGLMGFTMHQKTAGIIGTGRIGQATAKILLGFGCEILCYDPQPDSEFAKLPVAYVGFDELLKRSDIISLHCPLTPQSHHLIDAAALSKMRDNVMLINTSRGAMVDTQAVLQGLKSGKIGYLGLDVYEMESELFFQDHSEQLIDDEVFERLSTFHNVIITGHQGFFTREAMTQIATTTLGNLVAVAAGQAEPANLVLPEEN
ncbi:2-hydroxyacid dehydrogenase [Alteromonas sp. ASW11-19]|uniref:2-hydroxyacid dehydrogenase n=1 Tax=Alteromonas salexigens TaxID=2982530 RepID=A0ABT2VMD0_9ALTE|nr:2-hydroxyacid dehydrogenase [Alteromonas salexigens]MCU7554229.1 2-hydroxyacid dehydrogenase [Alteromonas salexigens]